MCPACIAAAAMIAAGAASTGGAAVIFFQRLRPRSPKPEGSAASRSRTNRP
jgi:hypothetical protein